MKPILSLEPVYFLWKHQRPTNKSFVPFVLNKAEEKAQSGKCGVLYRNDSGCKIDIRLHAINEILTLLYVLFVITMHFFEWMTDNILLKHLKIKLLF